MGDRGVFIVLEGSDGSGKSSQLRHLVQALQAQGRACYPTAEPTAGAIGQLIRASLRGEQPLDAETIALLFAADRRDHVATVIRPALDRGEVVVCDRYDLSNLVYRAAEQPVRQCPSCGWTSWETASYRVVPECCSYHGPDWPRADALRWAGALSRGLPRPDLTVVLDVPVDVALARRKARGGAERYDDPALQARVVELYRRAAELLPGERVVVVDGNAAEKFVAVRVRAAIADSGVLS